MRKIEHDLGFLSAVGATVTTHGAATLAKALHSPHTSALNTLQRGAEITLPCLFILINAIRTYRFITQPAEPRHPTSRLIMAPPSFWLVATGVGALGLSSLAPLLVVGASFSMLKPSSHNWELLAAAGFIANKLIESDSSASTDMKFVGMVSTLIAGLSLFIGAAYTLRDQYRQTQQPALSLPLLDDNIDEEQGEENRNSPSSLTH